MILFDIIRTACDLYRQNWRCTLATMNIKKKWTGSGHRAPTNREGAARLATEKRYCVLNGVALPEDVKGKAVRSIERRVGMR